MLPYFTEGGLTRRELVLDPLVPGHVYDGLSDTVLDGFINYVQIIKAIVIDDRNPLAKEGQSLNEIDVCIDSKWTKIEPKTKQEAHMALFKDDCSGVTHPQINQLQDRVLILAKVEDTPLYWYFDYGFTGADCALGRFRTQHSQMYVEEVFLDFAFNEHAKSLKDNRYPTSHPIQVPISFFNRGWISW
jgi:hypothetical protein